MSRRDAPKTSRQLRAAEVPKPEGGLVGARPHAQSVGEDDLDLASCVHGSRYDAPIHRRRLPRRGQGRDRVGPNAARRRRVRWLAGVLLRRNTDVERLRSEWRSGAGRIAVRMQV